MNLNEYLGYANKWMCDDSYVAESKIIKEDFDASDIISKATTGLSRIIKVGGEDAEGVEELKQAIDKVKKSGDKVTQAELKSLNDLYIKATVAVKDKTGVKDLKNPNK
jgi:hypothetical protein